MPVHVWPLQILSPVPLPPGKNNIIFLFDGNGDGVGYELVAADLGWVQDCTCTEHWDRFRNVHWVRPRQMVIEL